MRQHHSHKPVLYQEALASLNILPNGYYIDATFGRGGHSSAIVSHLGNDGKLIALDADPEAVDYARTHFAEDPRFSIHHSNFAEVASICQQQQIAGLINGVLFDLGVSSPQLDDSTRGFSFSSDGPLDMRMDTSCGTSAQDWLATASETEMANVFWQYGEERYSRRIARALVCERQKRPFTRTLALAEAVKAAHPRWEHNKHPATRVFQAIRIYINGELQSLSYALARVVDLLAVGAGLVVISFHSLEDRVVKRFIRGDHKKVTALRRLPVQTDAPAWCLRAVGKTTRPGKAELDDNPRARSAIMRVAEKLA